MAERARRVDRHRGGDTRGEHVLSYFNTNGGNPGTLTAPGAAGDYEIWHVAEQGPTVLATRPIQVK